MADELENPIPDLDPDLAAALAAKFGDPNESDTNSTDSPVQDGSEDETPDPDDEDEDADDESSDNEELNEADGGDESGEVTGYQLTLPDGSTVTLSPEQALAYYQFDQRLTNDPRFISHIQSYNPYSPSPPAGGGQSPPADTPPAGPSLNLDDLDLDDPNIKFLVSAYQTQQAQLESIQQATLRHDQQLNQEQSTQANALISSAQSSFKQKYEGLTDTDIQSITDAAARTGIVATYMAGVHPITGLPVSPDPIAAMDLAFESVYWANPTYREKAIASQAAQQRKDRIKKQKAGALSGNSGSAPRTAPNINNERERREAMVAAVAADMGME